MRLTSIEFSFDPCNIYRDVPRGVGYQADARSVGNRHPSCISWAKPSYCIHFALLREGFFTRLYLWQKWTDPNQTWHEENTSQRKPTKNLGPIVCVPRFFLSVYMSPALSTPSERKRPPISALNHVILPLIYANRKKSEFLRVGGGGSKK